MITITRARPMPGATMLGRALPPGAAQPVPAEYAPMEDLRYAPSALVPRHPLPAPLRAGVETLAGVGLGDVSVHYDSPRPASVQAHAFTQGGDIHLAPGQERHLPHEAWHVAQQRQGRVRSSGTVAGQPLNDDPGLEREADHMGARAAAMARHGGTRPAGHGLPSQAMAAAAPIQRVITYTKADRLGGTCYTPEELLENLEGTREAQAFIKANDGDRTALLDFLRGYDDTTVESREFLVNQIKGAARKDPEIVRQRTELIQEEKPYDARGAVARAGWNPRQSGEVYFKLGLLRRFCGQGKNVDRFEQMLGQVLSQAQAGAIGLAGVQRTLATLTTSWPQAPVHYEEDYRGNGTKSRLSGLVTTLMGLNGELDALYHASLRGRAPGETVFSGARLADTAAGVEEDVDVSFIDAQRVLHLIEVAGSLHVLDNKLREKDLESPPTGMPHPTGQKQRYQYLSRHSQTLRQEPVDGLVGSQALDQELAGVRFAYSVPEHGFYPAVYSPEGLSVLTALGHAGADLNVGPRSHAPHQVARLRERIAAGMAQVRLLQDMAPGAMQAAWNTLDGDTRAMVRSIVVNAPGRFPQVYHHIFHRQRRGVGTGLAGYSQL